MGSNIMLTKGKETHDNLTQVFSDLVVEYS